MDPRGGGRLFYQGPVRLCQYAGVYVDPELRRSQRQYFSVDLLLGYPTNLILTWKNRKRLVPKVYLPLAALVLAGSIPGAFLLKHVDARAVKVLFGVVVAALGAEMFSQGVTAKSVCALPGSCWRSSA